MRSASPLRYPGGKWRLTAFFSKFIADNFTTIPEYIEPYAGGASLALSLLFTGRVSSVWLNDLDPAIFSCWRAIIAETDRFCEAVERVPLTIEERQRQKGIYAEGRKGGIFSYGFSTFFLNRTNHSGILNGGMIGGKAQTGKWRLDARFNRSELIRRVRRIADFADRITLTRRDAEILVRALRPRKNCLVYLDPPYVTAGKALYMNSYGEADHASVRDAVDRMRRTWIVSYDDVPLVRRLYREYRVRRLDLLHTAREAKIGSEVLFFSKNAVIPPRTLSPAS